jgi:hypothetical protein
VRLYIPRGETLSENMWRRMITDMLHYLQEPLRVPRACTRLGTR